jgi:non-ribosomal peptide synthetase component F
LFVMQNTPQLLREFGGLKLGPLGVSSTSRFDLVLFINDPDTSPSATWMYNPNLFETSSIARIANMYELLLKSVVANPEIRVNALNEVLSEAEKSQRAAEQREFQETSQRKLKTIKRKAVTNV